MTELKMEVMYKPKKDPSYIQFYYYERTKRSREWREDGTLMWNGDEWVVFKDNPNGTLDRLLNKTWSIFSEEYTKKDRDFYEPFYYNPSTFQRVEISDGPPKPLDNTKRYGSPDTPSVETKDVQT